MTHTAAFAFFGTKPRNVQWSWSARNEDTKVVAVTLWRHEFSKEGNTQVYERGPALPHVKSRPGHTELMSNLRYALEECDGFVKVIIAVAKDPKADPKKIDRCSPTNMKVRVASLDEESGAFRLVAEMSEGRGPSLPTP